MFGRNKLSHIFGLGVGTVHRMEAVMITHVGTAQGPCWCLRTQTLHKDPGGGTGGGAGETLSGEGSITSL